MRPLEDVRVLAIEQYGAGPWGSLQLADLGADVIKIESPQHGGDVGRYVPPFQAGDDSLFFQAFNRNKRTITLDLTNRAGREVFTDLVRVSDAVYSNVRGDVPDQLRIRYDDLAAVNRRIVCCALSAFGATGELRDQPGYDYIIQAMAGWMSLTGEPDGPPQRTGISLVDFAGGLVAALALVVGLHSARRDGVGCDCDVALLDTAISLLNYPAAWLLNGGYETPRRAHSAHPSLVPFQLFETADRPIVVACAKEKFWQRFTSAVELPELADDPRFATFAERDRNRDELLTVLVERLRERPSADWLTTFAAVGVPAGPVNDLKSALDASAIKARDLIVEVDHPDFGTVREVATPIRLSNDVRAEHRRAPQPDEHGNDIAELLGYDARRRTELAAAGAFGGGDESGRTAGSRVNERSAEGGLGDPGTV